MTEGPLKGIRVLEFSHVVALPFGGNILSDLGAEVIKVEPLTGDTHRFLGLSAPIPRQSKRFMSLNRGKSSLAVDLRRAEGRDLIYRLMPHVDVVTNNYSVGVPERLGIDYETLKKLKPDLIYGELTGFGNQGPMRDRAGSDVAVNAYSGLLASAQRVNDEGLPSNLAALPVADYAGGFCIVIGILAALYHRALTGEGQKVETTLLTAALAMQPTSVMRDPANDAMTRDPLVERLRAARERGATYREVWDIYTDRGQEARDASAFFRTYEAKDGVVALGALTPSGRDEVRRVLELDTSEPGPPGAGEPSFVERVKAAMRTRTAAEWVAALAPGGVPVAPLNFPEEMADEPQVRAMDLMAEVEHPISGRQLVAGPVVRMSGTPLAVQGPSPDLGADVDAVLALAGLSAEEIAAARRGGYIL